MSVKDYKKEFFNVELNNDELASIISSLFNSGDSKLASKLIVLKAKDLLSYERRD